MGSAATQGDLWGRAARDWTDLQEPQHLPLFEAMLEAAGVGSGTRLCDIGCGGGTASLLASRRGARISGLDAAEALIGVARERLPGADLHVGDMESLPFADGSFDAVFAANSVQYSEDRVQALREMRRVCDPDGKVVVGLWGPPEKVEFRDFFQAVRDVLPEPPPGKGPFELSNPGALRGLIEDAGMKVTGSGEALARFEYPDYGTFWRAMRSAGPAQVAISQVGEEALADAVRSALRAYQAPDGSMAIANVFQYVVAAP